LFKRNLPGVNLALKAKAQYPGMKMKGDRLVKGRPKNLYSMIFILVLILNAQRVLSLPKAPAWRDQAAAAFNDEKREFLRDEVRFHSDVIELRQMLLRHADGAKVAHRRNLVRIDWNQIVADRTKAETKGADSTVDLAFR
jgi:hypothetical protein